MRVIYGAGGLLLLGCVLLGAVQPTWAEDDPLARAAALRNESGADWNKKDHAAAAEKLRKALEIYDRIEGESDQDRAITMRALVWNLVRAGDIEAAKEPMPRLMALAVKDEALWSEVNSAWMAIWEAASAKKSAKEAVALVDGLRAEAVKAKLDRLVGQALHDIGSLSRKHEDNAAAADYYEQAIKYRRARGDALGEAWSLNNLANMLLMGDELDEALPHLAAAYKLVHESGVVSPQSAIAWNLRKAMELMKKKPSAKHVAWLLKTAEHSEGSSRAAWVPREHLQRTALTLSVTLGKERDTKKLARSLGSSKPRADVPEIAADLVIRSALAGAASGDAKKAGSWLKKLEVGKGPCAAHLELRRKTAMAVCLAKQGRKSDFPDAARAAADGWRDFGDHGGRRQALQQLADAARAAELAAELPALLKEADEASREGTPGGLGGSASVGGDRSRAGDVPLHGVAFHIACDGKNVSVQDRISKHGVEYPLSWKPRRFVINGMSVLLFGGYVVVEAMSYGSSSGGGGSPGSVTMDDLGVYVPLPAQSALVVLKNGAVRYQTAAVTGR